MLYMRHQNIDTSGAKNSSSLSRVILLTTLSFLSEKILDDDSAREGLVNDVTLVLTAIGRKAEQQKSAITKTKMDKYDLDIC